MADDWQETLDNRKHHREQVTWRVFIVTSGLLSALAMGLIAHCQENSPPDPVNSHGNPCSIGAPLQPGETVTCPDYAKTPTP